MSGRLLLACAGVALVISIWCSPAGAQEINLTIRDHKFEPTEIRIPSGKRVSIVVSNEDATPEEFDSTALKVRMRTR